MDYKVGSFAKSGSVTTQNVAHGLGTTPTLVILFSARGTVAGTIRANYNLLMGAYDGSAARCSQSTVFDATAATGADAISYGSNKAIAVVNASGVVIYEATISAMDGTNFTMNWTTNDGSSDLINFIAFAGVRAKVTDFTRPTTPSNKSVTGVGFKPDGVLFFSTNPSTVPEAAGGANIDIGFMDKYGNQWALNHYGTGQGTNPTTEDRAQVTNRCLYDINHDASVNYEASFVSMDNDGFTINFSTVPGTARYIFAVCINGLNLKVGSFNKSTDAAPASQAITGFNLTPKAEGIIFASWQNISGTTATEGRIGLGASDGTNSRAMAAHSRDNVATTEADAVSDSKAFIKINNSTPAKDAVADFTSFDTDGFTLNWTTNDAVATQILYIAMADKNSVSRAGVG